MLILCLEIEGNFQLQQLQKKTVASKNKQIQLYAIVCFYKKEKRDFYRRNCLAILRQQSSIFHDKYYQ